MSFISDIWMKRGSDADLFSPNPNTINAATAPHFAAAAHQSLPPSTIFSSPLALSHNSPFAASFPHGQAPNAVVAAAAAAGMFSPVSPFPSNDAKKVKLDPLPKPGTVAALGGNVGQLNGMQGVGMGGGGGNFGTAPPSKVVVLWNLPEGTTNTELIALGAQDGKITAATIMDQKRQGFLEFEDERSSMSMVQRFSSPTLFRDKYISVAFGSSKEMKSMVANGGFPGAGGSIISGGVSPDPHMHPGMQQVMTPVSMVGSGDERSVLRVIVEMGENQNIYNQVNLDVLHHLFSRTGFVMKIITFAKPGYPQQFQALIQYMEAKAAQTAKEVNKTYSEYR